MANRLDPYLSRRYADGGRGMLMSLRAADQARMDERAFIQRQGEQSYYYPPINAQDSPYYV